VLDDDLTPDTRHYVHAVIAKFRTVNRDIPMTAANAHRLVPSPDLEVITDVD
jgi:hypothetical protein